MRYICVIFYLVLVINCLCAGKIYKRNTLDGYQSTDNTTKRSSHETQDECNLDRPPMPDFKKLGRRISETKCLEYIWDKEVREKSNLTACTKESKEKNESLTAIEGMDALLGEFPHMGAIGWRTIEGTYEFKCACSLISDKFILTAAHCKRALPNKHVLNIEPEIVRLGDKNLNDYSNGTGAQNYKILSIIVHPNYIVPKKYYDIALMKIETITRFTNNIQPACLWSHFDTTQLGTSATSTSWGIVKTETTSLVFQAAVVDIIDSNQCDNLLRHLCNRHWCGIEEHQLCAGKLRCDVDACQKDIGGPLQVKIPANDIIKGSVYNIIGIGSFGVTRPESDLPDVYTRVSSFINWIESTVWSEN